MADRVAVEASRLRGKVAIVTASTQGIGFGIARRLGLEGASVVVSSRKQKNVDEAVASLKSLGIDAFGVVCHVSDASQRQNLMQKTVDKYGRIDILVSNAASNPSVDTLVEISDKALDKLWEVNVKATVQVIQAAAPHLSEGSSIVLISSIAGYNPSAGLAMYSVAKTALLGLTKALAMELAPKTRVNGVAPGFVPTHFASYLTENEAIRSGIESQTLLKRLGTVDDMGAAVAFLVSSDASYITGETIVVAGGIQSRL
ncbi:hypothetical protein SELMODRAFT_270475 [Selaginella moellendorffii]|uniref:Uncharacterized protein n=1 Tax=Selaginella moellendorffii TaxID=88036 RepID=D8R221_SELML|nr:short-chain dehydrogenase/reductase SDRA [Selaginella moellendorffii]EFJ33650.1 hypothetical protein SELMODRAFT_270475 [Selaginella moellendorffii]|eukprot:XP_002964812.1 short-chain dehydrogenase/reductase SDRA [Selaginella moellendorffii]